MGASQSNKHNNNIESDYKKIIHRYKLQNVLSKEDFIRILSCCDNVFLKKLWNYNISTDLHCTESQFNVMVDQCRFKTGEKWLRYLMSVCGVGETMNCAQMRTVLEWVSFSCDGLYELLRKSFLQVDIDEVNVDEYLAWIDKNLPEIGVDLSRYLYMTLMGQLVWSGDVKTEMSSVIEGLNSDLISHRVMVALCASLPMCYKTSDIREEFLFMNVKSWTILYNSDVHGLSASKFKETTFDYDGHLLLLVKGDSGLYCVASDVGLKEDWNAYGGVDARFLQLDPIFKKYVSGTRSVGEKKSGIIYSHFSAKSGHRGLFVGHNPLKNTAIEFDEDLSKMSVFGKSEPIRLIEAWAVGANVGDKVAKLKDVRHWEQREVTKHKNRKIKAEDWTDSPDREILGMGGVNVRNADMVGGIDRDKEIRK